MLIGPHDRVRLPEGVLLREDGLADRVRGAVFSANASARFILAHADGRTVADIAGRLGPREVALADTVEFCARQNERLLLNVELRWGAAVRWLAVAVRMAPLGLVPPFPRRRLPLPSAAAWRALAGVGTIVAALAGGMALVLLTPGPAVILGACVGAGLVLHEAAHVAVLRGVPCCLVVAGLRVGVLHRALPPRRRRVVAAAGPTAAAVAGALVLAAAWLLSVEEAAIGAGPLAAHALGLTVLAGDGRVACGLS